MVRSHTQPFGAQGMTLLHSHGREANFCVLPRTPVDPRLTRGRTMAVTAKQLQEILAAVLEAKRGEGRRKGCIGHPRGQPPRVRGELGGVRRLVRKVQAMDQGSQPRGVHSPRVRRGQRFFSDRGAEGVLISAKLFAILGQMCKGEALAIVRGIDGYRGEGNFFAKSRGNRYGHGGGGRGRRVNASRGGAAPEPLYPEGELVVGSRANRCGDGGGSGRGMLGPVAATHQKSHSIIGSSRASRCGGSTAASSRLRMLAPSCFGGVWGANQCGPRCAGSRCRLMTDGSDDTPGEVDGAPGAQKVAVGAIEAQAGGKIVTRRRKVSIDSGVGFSAWLNRLGDDATPPPSRNRVKREAASGAEIRLYLTKSSLSWLSRRSCMPGTRSSSPTAGPTCETAPWATRSTSEVSGECTRRM